MGNSPGLQCHIWRVDIIYSQEPFPVNVEDIFKVELEEDVIKRLKNYLCHVETCALLSILTEYIVTELNLRNENDVDFP